MDGLRAGSLAPSLICGHILCPVHSCSCSWAIRGSWWRPGSQSLKMTVPGMSLSWSEGYKAEYVAIHSQRSKRAVCNNIQRGDSMQMTTRSKTWLLGAHHLICGCGGGGSGQEHFASGPHLSACPRPWACVACSCC